MRFTLMLGIGGCEDYQTLARAAEDAGWTSVSMPDSIFFPRETDSEYPYAETEAVRQFIAASPFIEPMVAMAWMAAVTTKLRFYPGVLKVPVRQPLVLAKALSSLAALTGNRIALGAGISPWREDFTYNGMPFEPRGKMMDECIEIIRGAMSGEFFEYHSEHFDFGPMKMLPVPTRPLPIIIGGHARPALARAARLGDGWMSANADFSTLEALVKQLNEFREQYGTLQRQDFEIHLMDQTASALADYQKLTEIGATDICVSPWNPYNPALTLQGKLDGIRRFGDDIIAKFG